MQQNSKLGKRNLLPTLEIESNFSQKFLIQQNINYQIPISPIEVKLNNLEKQIIFNDLDSLSRKWIKKLFKINEKINTFNLHKDITSSIANFESYIDDLVKIYKLTDLMYHNSSSITHNVSMMIDDTNIKSLCNIAMQYTSLNEKMGDVFGKAGDKLVIIKNYLEGNNSEESSFNWKNYLKDDNDYYDDNSEEESFIWKDETDNSEEESFNLENLENRNFNLEDYNNITENATERVKRFNVKSNEYLHQVIYENDDWDFAQLTKSMEQKMKECIYETLDRAEYAFESFLKKPVATINLSPETIKYIKEYLSVENIEDGLDREFENLFSGNRDRGIEDEISSQGTDITSEMYNEDEIFSQGTDITSEMSIDEMYNEDIEIDVQNIGLEQFQNDNDQV